MSREYKLVLVRVGRVEKNSRVDSDRCRVVGCKRMVGVGEGRGCKLVGICRPKRATPRGARSSFCSRTHLQSSSVGFLPTSHSHVTDQPTLVACFIEVVLLLLLWPYCELAPHETCIYSCTNIVTASSRQIIVHKFVAVPPQHPTSCSGSSVCLKTWLKLQPSALELNPIPSLLSTLILK